MEGFVIAAVLGAAALLLLGARAARDRRAGRALSDAARALSLAYRPGGLLSPPRAAGRSDGRPVSIVSTAAEVRIRLGWAGRAGRGETIVGLAAPPPRRWPPLGLDPDFETRIGIRGGLGAARLALTTAARAAVEEIADRTGDFRLEIAAPGWSGWGLLSLRCGPAGTSDLENLLGNLGRIAAELEASAAFARPAGAAAAP